MNDLPVLAPSGVIVVFPAAGPDQPTSGFYTVGVPLGSLQLVQYRNVIGALWNHVISRYESATFSGGNSGSPTNLSTLQSLATQVAADWYRWQLGQLEQQYVGVVANDPGAFHDREWSQGHSQIKTRVSIKSEKREDLLVPVAIAKGSECAVRDQTTCIAGREVRRLSYDCGKSWEIVEDLGPCGPGWPCDTVFPALTFDIAGPCIGGLDYVYRRTVQFYSDPLTGCTKMNLGSAVLTATGKCCSVCGSGGSGTTGGTGGTCAGLPCGYCVSTTPCQWTGTISCPDFGSGIDINNCSNCIAGTSASWSFTGAGFTGDFAVFNGSFTMLWGGESELLGCEWVYVLGPGGVRAVLSIFDTGTINLYLLPGAGLKHVVYTLAIGGAPIDCCIARTLGNPVANGTGAYPATIVVTPSACNQPVCSPDPSGTWTFTQLQAYPCAWSQYKSGVTGVVNLLYDPIGQQFELLLVLTSSDYVMVFVYLSPLGQTTFDCTRTYHLHLISSPQCVCSDTPVEIILTPISQAAACCTGLTGTGTTGTGSTGTGGNVCGSLGAHLCAVVAGSSSLDGRYNFTWNAGIQEWIGVIGGCTFHISCPVNPADVTQYLLSNDTFGGSDSPQAGSTVSPLNLVYTRFGILGPCGDVPPSSPTITFSQGFC